MQSIEVGQKLIYKGRISEVVAVPIGSSDPHQSTSFYQVKSEYNTFYLWDSLELTQGIEAYNKLSPLQVEAMEATGYWFTDTEEITPSVKQLMLRKLQECAKYMETRHQWKFKAGDRVVWVEDGEEIETFAIKSRCITLLTQEELGWAPEPIYEFDGNFVSESLLIAAA